MQKFPVLLYCLFIIINTATAQTARNSHVQEFTTENGLPSNGIKGLEWDETTGFLWIATEAGIVRFTGVDFRSYTKENMSSMSYERMLFVKRNNAGVIYISDVAGNIFSIQQNKPVLWKKFRPGTNPYYSHYYLLPVSDTLFNRYTGTVQSPPRFSAVTDKIICFSDTSFLILSSGTLYYQSLSLRD